MTTQTVTLRRPTFSLRKTLSPIGNFFVSIFNAVVEARRMESAFEVAYVLQRTNPDFKDMSHGEIVNRIMDNK